MKIEIAANDRMTMTGSALFKLIQNNSMPNLDLLVRESIQNSMDAKREEKEFVNVEFLTGTFDKHKLNNELEDVTESLNKIDARNKYIAVRDSNTEGLTGALNENDVKDGKLGNLLKLIYKICQPQQNEGSGGSWGIGKTVYFRMGIGLVIYYSRVLNEKNEYESRLAAVMIENEKESDIIPAYNKGNRSGIAWWGEEIAPNKTQPITEETYINTILSIFEIKPYIGNETGTTIIIPYIDEQELLENNRKEYLDSNGYELPIPWKDNLKDYLMIAIQRWYAPRIDNKYYKNGYLCASVNGDRLTINSMNPIFKVIQELYNSAAFDMQKDFKDSPGIEFYKEDIKTTNKIVGNQKVGAVAFAKVSSKILGITPPNNNPLPSIYLNLRLKNTETNSPIVAFTRKPGMIVSYEEDGRWIPKIESINANEFIFAVFVLNSDNRLDSSTSAMSLEEYVRNSEMADHTAWNDHPIDNRTKPTIIERIQDNLRKKVEKTFKTERPIDNTKKNVLSKRIGEMILPPQNFGRKPNGNNKPTHSRVSSSRNGSFSYEVEDYLSKGIKLTLDYKSKENDNQILLAIVEDGRNISIQQWCDSGLEIPFEIEALEEVYPNNNYMPTISCVEIKNKSKIGIKISSQGKNSIDLTMKIEIKIHNKNVKLALITQQGGKNE